MSPGCLALSRANSCRRSFLACFAGIPAFDPVRKNFSMPRCRKLLITLYSVTIHVTEVKCQRRVPRSATFQPECRLYRSQSSNSIL